MANRVCTNFKDTLGNDLGCRFITKEDAVDFIVALNDYSEAQITPWGAGKNDTYQLGLGADTTNRSSPVVVGSGAESRKWSGLSGGFGFAASLNVDGNIWSWGLNSDGQLGDSSTITKSNPVLVSGVGGFKGIMAGREFVVGVKHTGTLWAWGKNHCGQLGDSTTITKSCPVQIGALTCWKNVWAYSNGYTAAGITEDGKLFRWGINTSGQIGDGTTINKSSPVQVGAGTDWRTVNNSHALKTNGTLWAWGSNAAGRLGDGTTVGKSSPVQIGAGTDWKYAVSITNNTAAIKTNGTLWTWGCGVSTAGLLGDGTTIDRSSPVQVGTATNWKNIAGTMSSFVAMKTDGSIWGWGCNCSGELGDGTSVVKTTPIQITAHNDIFCVGQSVNNLLILREPKILSSNRPTGMQANTVDFDVHFVRREHFICAGAMTWGLGTSGQLGDNSTTSKSSPVQLAKTGSIWRDITAGYNFMNGIQNDGTLWSWGQNGAGGKLGDGTTINKSTPIQIGVLSWRQSTAGVSAAAAIRCDGTLWTWGSNSFGQLGDGTTVTKSSPVQVGTSGDWLCVQYTFCTMAALKTNGTLWAWGANVQGQIGDGTTVSKSSPVQVGTGTDWINFSISSAQAMGQKSDYTLWSWGHDQCGLLMTAAAGVCYSTPVQANSGSTLWRHFSVRSGGAFFGIKCDSSLWAVGVNTCGRLGDGTAVTKTTPVLISSCGWKSVSPTYLHTAAIKTDGTLWAWGRNDAGELGDGSTVNKSSPVQVGAATNWVKVTTFNNHTVALREEC